MKRLMAVALAGLAVACGGSSGNNNNPDGGSDPNSVEVSANIAADTRWVAGKTYTLKQAVFVESGTLTIEAGVKVLGDLGSSLVVTKNARIHAEGTATAPIVFTSSRAAGSRRAGDWGGVVLLGKAPINVSGGSNKIEGFPASQAGTDYGGSDAAHDCGTLKYARIEFAGFELAPNNELNGLTMGGCGSNTVIDYVQSHLGSDDGVEIFGGTVNIKHIVISQPDDDGLDFDYGWVGKGQFIVIQQSARQGNNGIEADNNGSAPDALPRSAPELWNVTMVGSNADPGKAADVQQGMLLRRGTAGKMSNFIVTGFADQLIDVDGAQSKAQAEAGNLVVKNSIFFDNANLNDTMVAESGTRDNDQGFLEIEWLKASPSANRFTDPKLADAYNLTAPSFKPLTDSPVFTGGATPPSDGFFDATATFVGAIGANDWTAGWTAFPAN